MKISNPTEHIVVFNEMIDDSRGQDLKYCKNCNERDEEPTCDVMMVCMCNNQPERSKQEDSEYGAKCVFGIIKSEIGDSEQESYSRSAKILKSVKKSIDIPCLLCETNKYLDSLKDSASKYRRAMIHFMSQDENDMLCAECYDNVVKMESSSESFNKLEC